MEPIFNDANGIRDKAAFDAVKANVHPVTGRLRSSISYEAALKTKRLFLRPVDDKNVDDIKSLDFLRFFPNLERFHIFSKKLSDIHGLRYLTKATVILLSSDWQDGVDLSVVGNCRELEDLEITLAYTTSVEQRSNAAGSARGLGALNKLSKLKNLSLRGLGITDFSFIEYMPLLEIVDLTENDFSDLTPFQGSSALKDLSLNNCGLTDISVLSTTPNLEYLEIVNNNIKDFSPLKGLKSLKTLAAFDNGLSSNEISYWENEFSHLEYADFIGDAHSTE